MATIKVIETTSGAPILKAKIDVNGRKISRTHEGADGTWNYGLTRGDKIKAIAFNKESPEIDVSADQASGSKEVLIELDLNLKLEARTEDGSGPIPGYCYVGQIIELRADIYEYSDHVYYYKWNADPDVVTFLATKYGQPFVHLVTNKPQKNLQLSVTITDKTTGKDEASVLPPFVEIQVIPNGTHALSSEIQRTGGNIADKLASGVTLKRTRGKGTPEILTWRMIESTTEALSFNNYKAYMDLVMCNDDEALLKLDSDEQVKIKAFNTSLRQRQFLPFTDTDAYRLLRVATEAFLIVKCGVLLDGFIDQKVYNQLLSTLDAEDASGQDVGTFWQQFKLAVNGGGGYVLPYLLLIRNKLPDLLIRRNIMGGEDPFKPEEAGRCFDILAEKLLQPCMVELIWSYWHEEGMLVQTMNAISRRFQNIRGPADRDPLAMVEIDPLRPLNNLLWGYIQDEQHRLTVVRRAYEYDHHYGLSLEGKAVSSLYPADSRSRFLEAFHQLLHLTSVFYKQDADTTMIADGFPLVNALRDLHIILSEGAHNQFGDLPTTARIEMLMQQWLLARPEFREYLPTRIMVAYPEPWMDRVDAMKRLQGWTETNITHFRFLAIYGEQILLSIRFTRWSEINDADLAAIWARLFRNQVQGYIHAYRAVTGVDLSAEIMTTQQRELITTKPSVLLRQRLQDGRTAPALPAGQMVPALRAGKATAAPQGFRQRQAARKLLRG